VTVGFSWGNSKPPAGTPLDPSHPLARGLVLACPLNDGLGGGTASDLGARVADLSGMNRNGTFAAGSTYIKTATRHGFGVRSINAGGTNTVSFGPSNAILPTTACTVVIGYRKTDATNRASSAFGGGTGAAAFGAHLPYSDGTVYWDFGGTSAGNRLSKSGLAFGDDLWAFTYGGRGQEIWQNGRRQATGVVGGGRTGTSSSLLLGLYNGIGADLAETWLFLIYNRELTPSEIREVSASPFSMFAPPVWRRYVISIPPNPSTLAGTLQQPTASLSADETITSTVAGALDSPTASLTAAETITSSVAGSLPPPTASLTGTESITSSVAGSLPPLEGSFTVDQTTTTTGSGGHAGRTRTRRPPRTPTPEPPGWHRRVRTPAPPQPPLIVRKPVVLEPVILPQPVVPEPVIITAVLHGHLPTARGRLRAEQTISGTVAATLLHAAGRLTCAETIEVTVAGTLGGDPHIALERDVLEAVFLERVGVLERDYDDLLSLALSR